MTDTVENAPEIDAEASNETPETGNKAAQEAKRYRLQLREAEAALEAANARIEGFQRAEVERLASESLSVPGDLFTLSGTSVADYLTEDGSVNAEAVSAAAAAVLAERPGMSKPQPAVDPTQGLGGAQASGPSWSDLFTR